MICLVLSIFAALPSCAPLPQQQQAYNYQTPTTPQTPVSYNFDWNVNAIDGFQQPVNYGHQEQRQGNAVQGTYFVLLPHGQLMRVNYIADQTGFHPTITFEPYPGAAASGQAVLGAGSVASPPSTAYNTPLGK